MTTNNAPIACALGGTDYAERLAWIASLNRDGLLSHQRHGAALELRYAAAVRERVHELVRKESECCAFLAFALDESGSDVRLTITAPDRVRDAADVFFEPFLTSESPTPTGRCAHPANGCCS
ncbi:MAG: hypothetical protein ABL961_18440 [Vicinamibacterales bacterium]